MNLIRMARVRPGALLPTRKHPADAGLDLYAATTLSIPPHSASIVPTGITVEIPEGYVGLVKPKGRNDHLLGAGVVDAGYQGEILVKVVNPFARPLEITAGDAIAQLIILPVVTPAVEEVSPEEIHTHPSSRGATGGIITQWEGTSQHES